MTKAQWDAVRTWAIGGDWYLHTYYSTSPSTDPSGPASGTSRVHRGGHWFSIGGHANFCRVAIRSRDTPGCHSYALGFRAARSQ